MLRVPPSTGTDGGGSPAPADPLAAAAGAQRSRLTDAAWMLESETALQEGLGRAMTGALDDGAPGPVAARLDREATALIEKLFAAAPGDVSDAALGQARERAGEAQSAAAGIWRAHHDEAGPERALGALRRNLVALFRDGRQAGADQDTMVAAALGRIELLRGALPDAALAGMAGWSRGMAAAARLDGALARGDAEGAEALLADRRLAASLPDDARGEFTRRAGIVRLRGEAGDIRRELRDRLDAFGRNGGAGPALDRAVEKAAGSARIRDEQERAAFGWSLRADLARTRAIKETRRLAVERDFRARLADPAVEAEDLFTLLDRAETEGLLDADRLARLRREMTFALERRAGTWRAALDGARHLADPAGFDRTDRNHRAAIDAWWREMVERAAPAALEPDAEEAGLFAEIRPETERAIPGASAGPDEIAGDVAAQTGYLPMAVQGRLLATWRAGSEKEIAHAAGLAAGIAGANADALVEMDSTTLAGLLATAFYLRGGISPEQAVAAARREVTGETDARIPDRLPAFLAGGDETAVAGISKLLTGPAARQHPRFNGASEVAMTVPAEDGGADALSTAPGGIARVEDEDGRTVVRDPDTGEVIGETDFNTADAIGELLQQVGLGKDFESLSEAEKQALIDAAGMIPGIGVGISALQAYEAALAAARAWKSGDYGEAALQGLLAGLDAAGAIPGLGKAFKAIRLFGGFLGRAARKGATRPGRMDGAWGGPELVGIPGGALDHVDDGPGNAMLSKNHGGARKPDNISWFGGKNAPGAEKRHKRYLDNKAKRLPENMPPEQAGLIDNIVKKHLGPDQEMFIIGSGATGSKFNSGGDVPFYGNAGKFDDRSDYDFALVDPGMLKEILHHDYLAGLFSSGEAGRSLALDPDALANMTFDKDSKLGELQKLLAELGEVQRMSPHAFSVVIYGSRSSLAERGPHFAIS